LIGSTKAGKTKAGCIEKNRFPGLVKAEEYSFGWRIGIILEKWRGSLQSLYFS